jgi:predicted S18 family serine protease
MKANILLALLLLLAANAFAACSGSAHMPIPAVFEDNISSNGELINVSIDLTNGSGNVFMKTVPHVGISTQQSANDAIHYAFYISNMSFENCDAYVGVESTDIIGEIDGPSAGMAFSVLAFAVLNDLGVRRDATITGGVASNGSVIGVGGIYEKAIAAGKSNLAYFVMPTATVHEKVLLIPVKEQYGIKVIEIRNAIEAINFFVFNASMEEKPLEVPKIELPEIEDYSSGDIGNFPAIAKDIIDIEEASIAKLPADNYSNGIRQQFQELLRRQRYLFSKGYYFTAANDAFNSYVDVSTFAAALGKNGIGIEGKKDDIASCLDSLQGVRKTRTSYQAAIGADIREYWARETLNSTTRESAFREDRYAEFNELMFADAWCRIAKSIEKNTAAGDEETIDESAWKEIAQEKIQEAKSLKSQDEEWDRHLNTADMLFENGKYGAAATDATFAITMYTVDSEFASVISEKNISDTVSELMNETRTSLWGKIYQAHGAYLSQTGEDQLDAYRILRYAHALDALNDEFESRLGIPVEQQKPQPNEIVPEQPKQSQQKEVPVCPAAYVFLSVIVLAFLLAYSSESK